MKIINYSKCLLLVFSAMIVSSCMARLKVKVNTADRDEVIAEVERGLKRELPSIIENLKYLYVRGESVNRDYLKFLKEKVQNSEKNIVETEGNYEHINGLIIKAENLYDNKKYLNAFHESIKAENELVIHYETINNFLNAQESLNNELTSMLKEHKDKEVEKEKKIEEEESKGKGGKEDSSSKKDELESFKESISKIEKSIENVEKAIIKISEIQTKVVRLENDVEKSKNISNKLRFNLLGDPLTSFVTKNNNKNIWRSKFNQTKVSTFMGDTDIAILLRKNPDEQSNRSGDYNNNFTIKGVRLDAEDVIEASFKTLSQSINLFASIQMAGTNLTSNETSTEFSQLPVDINNSLQSIDANKNKLAEKREELARIRKLLFRKIIFQDYQEGDGEIINVPIEELKSFWTSLKSELNTVKSK